MEYNTQAKCIEWAKQQEKIRLSPEGREKYRQDMIKLENDFKRVK